VDSEEDLARLTAVRAEAEAVLIDEAVVVATDDRDDDPRETPVPV
jgi:hypothetical protein